MDPGPQVGRDQWGRRKQRQRRNSMLAVAAFVAVILVGAGAALFYAIEAGADRIHGTVLGIGERVGNTPLDLLLVNLKLLGHTNQDLESLTELVEIVAEACNWDIPVNYPVFGRDAFRTGTGVHAAAVIKAELRGDTWLSDRIYSGVPASWFGRRQEIAIGHMSGESNVRYWLNNRGFPTDDVLVKKVFQHAKSTNSLLHDDEILAIVEQHTAQASP